MSSHRDSSADEDEDDYGCYFLQPVNEYTIGEKIIEANRTLFGIDFNPSDHPKSTPGAFIEDISGQSPAPTVTDPATGSTRRVTFRSELEDYEPDIVTDNEDEEDYEEEDEDEEEDDEQTPDSASDNEVDEMDEERVIAKTVSEQQDKISMLLDSPNRRRLPSTESSNVTQADGPATEPNSNEVMLTAVSAKEVAAPIVLNAPCSPVSAAGDEDDIDEICEVIEGFGLAETNGVLSVNVPPVALTSGMSSPQGHRQLHQESEEQSSETSDSNQSADSQAAIDSSWRAAMSPRHSAPAGQNRQSSQRPNSYKRNNSHQSSIANNHHQPSGNSSIDEVETILKIQLNFKPCCEFKNAEARRLPRYCGYVSQYGLSKEQLDRRDTRRERHNASRERRIESRAAVKSDKSRVNEEAFARWLAVKMRSTCRLKTNVSKNMFDCTPVSRTSNMKTIKGTPAVAVTKMMCRTNMTTAKKF